MELAEAALTEAERQFPDSPAVLLRRSYFIDTHRSTEEALSRWREMKERLPDYPDGYVHLSRHLADSRRVDEAEAVAAEGLQRFPHDKSLLACNAHIAHKRGDLLEAKRRWAVVLEHYPDWAGAIGQHEAMVAAIANASEASALAAR